MAMIGGNDVLNVLGLSRLGTQRVYGRNGSQIVAEYGGELYVIAAVTNPQFAKAIKKYLPIKNGLCIKYVHKKMHQK